MAFEPFNQSTQSFKQHLRSVSAVALVFAAGSAYLGYLGLKKLVSSSPSDVDTKPTK
jgi:threonine/homoserine/homoserine lactone efflux protein